MTERAQIRVPQKESGVYASRGDFHTIFNEDLKQLYQLSFLLTRDTAKAVRCLVVGLDECVKGNPVFREWARSWAKRVMVQNAIRETKPRPIHSNSHLSDTSLSAIDELSSTPDRHFELEALLNLEDFERFVFVMSILEHYSDHDCALLLGCSVREIMEARARALRELMKSSQGLYSRKQPTRAGEEMTHCLQSIRTDSRLYSAANVSHGDNCLRPAPLSSTSQHRTRRGWRNPSGELETDESVSC